MIDHDAMLGEKREQLYHFIQISFMTKKERMALVDACRARLLDMDKIDEILSVNPIPFMLAEAALDEITD